MTDEMLAWQTERFTELAVSPDTIRDGYVVPLRPEQVVEIALDGVQRSTRYAGGVRPRRSGARPARRGWPVWCSWPPWYGP